MVVVLPLGLLSLLFLPISSLPAKYSYRLLLPVQPHIHGSEVHFLISVPDAGTDVILSPFALLHFQDAPVHTEANPGCVADVHSPGGLACGMNLLLAGGQKQRQPWCLDGHCPADHQSACPTASLPEGMVGSRNVQHMW